MLPRGIVTSLCFVVFFTATLSTEVARQRITQKSIQHTTTRQCVISRKPQLSCDGLKYRTLDGTCNNLASPYAGAINTPFKRLLQPVYGDNKRTFRRASDKSELPPARIISNAFNAGSDEEHVRSSSLSAMHVQFGQFITHDFVHAIPRKVENGVSVNCTSCELPSASCINVPISRFDPFYKGEVQCIPLMGSQIAEECDELPTEQITSLSAYIDGTTIYGTTREFLDALRDPNSESGELLLKSGPNANSESGCPFRKKHQNLPTKTEIPHKIAQKISCLKDLNPTGATCFVSGDVRTNENIGLSSMHLIFAREHNRVGRRLKSLNPSWSSEIVFQEAKRILSAIFQIITYDEFLPPLIGPTLMKRYGLELVRHGYYYGYDASVDATIANSFTTAALRYGHSQVGKFFFRPEADYVTPKHPKIPTFKALFQQQAVLNMTTPSILRGLSEDKAFETDLSFVTDIRNRMFESSTKPGQDLFAINIQRGREHGLAPYNEFRELCGMPRAINWEDLSDDMTPFNLAKLQVVYNQVDDIDLYVGGLAESPVEGGSVGPVFGCILALQFRELRKGDRFWHENPGQFSIGQLKELRKASQGKIFCDNLDGMETVAPLVMLQAKGYNERVPCSSLPDIDLTQWRELDNRQDGQWTRWFLLGTNTVADKLLKQRKYNSDSVCPNPLDTQVRSLSKTNTLPKKVRFLCPKGTIPSSVPNSKQSLDCYWTSWMDRQTPTSPENDDIESLSDYLLESRPQVCHFPLYIQAQTSDGVPAMDTGDVFEEFNTKRGLICRGNHQENGKCHDYRVRFYCRNMNDRRLNDEQQKGVWSRWSNLSTPSRGHLEVESVGTARALGYLRCRTPIKIEARVIGSKTPYEKSGDALKRLSVYHGLLCDNRDQSSGRCHDYEVRYLCATY